MFRAIKQRLSPKNSAKLAVTKESEVLYLMSYVKERIAQIHLDMEDMSDEEMTVHSLSLDSLEKSYYYLFGRLRILRGLPSFEEVRQGLTSSPNYEEWNDRYGLDQIPSNFKFIGNFRYQEASPEKEEQLV